MSMQLTIFEHSKTEKRCSKCKEVRTVADFCKDKRAKDKLQTSCNQCKKDYRINNKEALSQYTKVYRENNKESIVQYKKCYYSQNKELIEQRRKIYIEKNKKVIAQRMKIYQENNKQAIAKHQKDYRINNKEALAQYKKAYIKQKLKSEPLFRLIYNLKSRVRYICKSVGLHKNWRTLEAIGCNREEFKTHFESKFTEGMTWENYGAWHVDHIKPISLATTEQEAIQLSHYTNLQPLWAEDNIRKSNKYD